MKAIKSLSVPAHSVVYLVLLAAAGSLHADALNENRILRKAGGPTDGTLTHVLVTSTHPGFAPVTQASFDRTGSAKIPKSEGKAKSLVEHEGLASSPLNTVTQGKVKQADVKQNGRKIKYEAVGSAVSLNYYGDGPAFTGKSKATSTIRGKKVFTIAKLLGSRLLSDGETTQVATAVASGTGKY